MKRLILIALVVGCGPKVKFPSDDRPDREVIDCPTGPALDRAADEAWDTTRLGDDAEHEVKCVSLFNHEPLWLLDGSVWGADEIVAGTALTTTRGELRWKDVSSKPTADQAEELEMSDGFTAVDLDGDGHDELVEVAGVSSQELGMRDWLTVYAIADGKLVAATPLPVDGENEGCSGGYEVINAKLGRHHVVITHDDGCPKPGRHVYAWDGTQLVEE